MDLIWYNRTTECLAVTDQKKSEMFKYLVNNTMKNLTTKYSIIAEHVDCIESEAKVVLDKNGNVDHLGIIVKIIKLKKN